MAKSDVAVPAAPKTGERPKRPWRDNLEAFGVAILAAVLLKPMLIEAYQIPTSSMQPTLMGSAEAGIYDRILVDKTRYEFVEPKRWDIGVFRYPIRRNQNYVKRIVGVPGDHLRIAGGNLWQVAADGSIDHVNRKPDRIQKGLWKQIYPFRRYLDESTTILGQYFEGQPGIWNAEGEDLVGTPSPRGRMRLSFTCLGHNGLSNQLYDGYSPDVGRKIKEAPGGAGGDEGVQDLRLTASLTPEQAVSALTMQIKLTPPGHPSLRYQLHAEGGKARLVILVDDEQRASSEPFDLPLAAGTATSVSFAHVDDRLLAEVGGDRKAALEVGDNRTVLRLEPKSVGLSLEAESKGKLRVADLAIDRDLHYVQEGLADDLANLVPPGKERSILNHVIEIPEGHYMMMGDNTLASADSRQWYVITIGMKDGWLVDPRLAKTDPTVRVVRGNKRPWNLNVKPDVDENPVIVRSSDPSKPDRVAFTDENGEVFALKAKLSEAYDQTSMRFKQLGGGPETEFTLPEEHVFFVPREHVLGRPMLTFWPAILPFRLGFIR